MKVKKRSTFSRFQEEGDKSESPGQLLRGFDPCLLSAWRKCSPFGLRRSNTQPEAGTKLPTSSWTLENIQSLVSYLVLFYDSLMTFYLYFVYRTYFLISLSGWPGLKTNSKFTFSVLCKTSKGNKEFVFVLGTPWGWKKEPNNNSGKFYSLPKDFELRYLVLLRGEISLFTQLDLIQRKQRAYSTMVIVGEV